MTITANQLKYLWTAKSKLGISDDVFRSALVQIAGVESSRELDRDGLDAMLGFFEYCGWQPRDGLGPNYGEREGMASFAQIALIRALWREYTRYRAGEGELTAWLEHYWQIASLRFLTREAAPKVITALKAMKKRTA